MEESNESSNNEKKKPTELLIFNKQKLKYRGFCSLRIDTLETIRMDIHLDENTTFEIPFDRQFIQVKNILCIVASKYTKDMILYFMKESTCIKTYEAIKKFKISTLKQTIDVANDKQILNDRFVSPLRIQMCTESDDGNQRLKEIIKDVLNFQDLESSGAKDASSPPRKIFTETNQETTIEENNESHQKPIEFEASKSVASNVNETETSPILEVEKDIGIPSSIPLVETQIESSNSKNSEIPPLLELQNNDSIITPEINITETSQELLEDENTDLHQKSIQTKPSNISQSKSIESIASNTDSIFCKVNEIEMLLGISPENNISRATITESMEPGNFVNSDYQDPPLSPSIKMQLDRLINQPMMTLKRKQQFDSENDFDENEEANIEADETGSENSYDNELSSEPPEKRSKVAASTSHKTKSIVVPSPYFELIQFEGYGMEHAVLTIFTNADRTYCYDYSWHKQTNLFICIGCKSKSRTFGTIAAAKLKANNNGETWIIEQNNFPHECIPVLYKPYNKNEKCVKKENYEIIESFTLKGTPGKELYIFENAERLSCRKFSFNPLLNHYFCPRCFGKGVKVIALICKTKDGDEYIQLGLNDHVCIPAPYDTISRKMVLSKKLRVRKPKSNNAGINSAENPLINHQFNNNIGYGINPFYSPNIINPQWNGFPLMATQGIFFDNQNISNNMPANNYPQHVYQAPFNNVSSNNFINDANNNINYNCIQTNNYQQFVNNNGNYNLENSIVSEMQKQMLYQTSRLQQNQATSINNAFNGNSIATSFSNNTPPNFQIPNPQPSSIKSFQMQSEIPFQDLLMQNQATITKTINPFPTTGFSPTPGSDIRAALIPVFQPSKVIAAKEFSNIHDFEIRYQPLPPPTLHKYTLIVFSSAAKSECYKLYFNKDHGIFICGKCLKRNQPTFVELCRNNSTEKYYLKFGGKSHICKLSNYQPINPEIQERELRIHEYEPLVKKEAFQQPPNLNPNVSNNSGLENNSIFESQQANSINFPTVLPPKKRIITSENFKFGPNTIGKPNAKIEVMLKNKIYVYYQQQNSARYVCGRCQWKGANVTATKHKNEANGETYFVLNDVEHVCQ